MKKRVRAGGGKSKTPPKTKKASAKRRERVVILGGGMAGVTAALALSDREQKNRYDITLYQMGWRLGGKGASGRNADRKNRIEEHGLHVWFGAYHNAIGLMRACYEEYTRKKLGGDTPFKRFDDAFKPQDHALYFERFEGRTVPWPFRFPRQNLGQLPDPWGYVVLIVKWVLLLVGQWWTAAGGSIAANLSFFRDGAPELGRIRRALRLDARLLRGIGMATPPELAAAIRRTVAGMGLDGSAHLTRGRDALIELLQLLANIIWGLVRGKVRNNDSVRQFWMLFHLANTVAIGVIKDGLLDHGFADADDEEFRTWLYRHEPLYWFWGSSGKFANDLAYQSPLLRTFYDTAFAYEDGDSSRPALAAGTAIRAATRLALGYNGSIAYEMQAGMGDAVFAPIFRVLENRGVAIKFFHRVTDLEPSKNGKRIARIHISRQVRLKGKAYRPLIRVKKLLCWPSEPRYTQLAEDPQELKKHNLEHYGSGWNDTGDPLILEWGPKKDFDHAVLAITLACLPDICGKLIDRSPAWKHMKDRIKTVQTQAMQLWFEPDRQALGRGGPPVILDTYSKPFANFADFTHLLGREGWAPNEKIGYLAYGVGVMEDGQQGNNPDAAVKGNAIRFLENAVGPIWPGGVRADDPNALDWRNLYDPQGATGKARLDAQYLRANVDPVERYVLSVPGSHRHRLKAGDSGFENLTLAGTWIDTGLNISAIETAVMSGLQASRVISGKPQRIKGESDLRP